MYFFIFIVDLNGEDIIPPKNKRLLNAFDSTSIQYILRKMAFLRNEEKKSHNLIGFLRSKTKKWINEDEAKIESQLKNHRKD